MLKSLQRIIAAMLCVVLVCASVPIGARAETLEDAPAVVAEEPAADPAAASAADPASGSAPEPAADPASGSAPEPAADPAGEPAPAPAKEPVEETAHEAAPVTAASGQTYVDVACGAPTITADELAEGASITVTANVTGGNGTYAYNYWLFDGTGTIVLREENTFEGSWTFTAPGEGVYLMRVYATDFVTEDFADSDWFYIEGSGADETKVDVSSVTLMSTPESDGTLTATAEVTGGSGVYAYNYWLFNSSGVIVDSLTNTFETSWTFTVPTTPGVYLMRIYATDFATEDFADSDWFYIEGDRVDVSAVTVSGTLETGMELTATAEVTGGSGSYAYNYWLFDSAGTIVARNENTFDSSWTFQAPESGVYLMRIYATDFATEDYADSDWFYVEAAPEGVLRVNAERTVTLTAGERKTFAFTAPEDGTYYFYSTGSLDTYGILYSDAECTDMLTCNDDGGEGNNFLMSCALTAGTTVYLQARFYSSSTSGSMNLKVATSIPLSISYVSMNTSVMVGSEQTVSVFTSYSSAETRYSYYLMDSEGNVLDSLIDSESSYWTFTAPEAEGSYRIRVVVTDGSQTAESTRTFVTALFRITSVGTSNVDTGEEATVWVYTNGSGLEGVVYSYFLQDSQGNTLDSLTNSTESTWTVTAPETPGVYTVRVFAAYDGVTSEKTSPLYVGQFLEGVYCDSHAGVGIPVNISIELAYYVSEDFLVSYTVIDSDGNVVDQLANSTETVWAYTPSNAGTYTVRATAAHNGNTMTKETVLTVYPTAVLTLGQTVTLHSNSTNTCYYFVFTAPADGTYYISTTGECSMYYVSSGEIEARSAVPGSSDLIYSVEMSAGETRYFKAYCGSIGDFSVRMTSEQPVVLEGVTLSCNESEWFLEGYQVVAHVSGEGALAYNYYLLDAQGNTVLSNEGVTENEWTFTMPGSGWYQVYVYGTNWQESAERYSSWVLSYTDVSLTTGVPAATYSSAVAYTFTAQQDGHYRLAVRSQAYIRNPDYHDYDFDYGYESGYYMITYEFNMNAGETIDFPVITENGDAASIEASVTLLTDAPIELYFESDSTYIGGHSIDISVEGMYLSGESVSGAYNYQLLEVDLNTGMETAVLSSGWTYETSWSFTLPDKLACYLVRVYGTPDGQNICTANSYDYFRVSPSSRVVSLSEGVSWSGTVGDATAFVFQAPETDTYLIRMSSMQFHIKTSSDSWTAYGYQEIPLTQGEWVYVSIPMVYSPANQYSVSVGRGLCVTSLWVNSLTLAGTECSVYASAYSNSDDYSNTYSWTFQLFRDDGTLVRSYIVGSRSTYSDCKITLPESGSYFVRAIITDGTSTVYLDSKVFAVLTETPISLGTTVSGTASTNAAYKFVAPASGKYTISAIAGSNWPTDQAIYFIAYNNGADYADSLGAYGMDGPGGVFEETIMLTKGQIIYLCLADFARGGGDYTLTISR